MGMLAQKSSVLLNKIHPFGDNEHLAGEQN